MSEELSRKSSTEEVIIVFNQTHRLKALGPEGTPAFFISKFWNVVKDYSFTVVLDILNHNISHEPINHTHITLIPKPKLPETPKKKKLHQ